MHERNSTASLKMFGGEPRGRAMEGKVESVAIVDRDNAGELRV